jgi:hypothetical protein
MATTGSLSNTTTTRKDGVRVDKGIEPGENHMRVHYRIVSEREDDAAIRVEESLAAAFPLDALDLDASGGGDWLLDGASDRVALLDIIGAGEEVTTGYVVRCGDPNAVASIVDAPEIDMVDPVDGGGASEEGGSAGRDGSREGGDGGDGASTTQASQAMVASSVDANVIAAAIDPGAVADALDADALASAVDPEAVVDAMNGDEIAAALDAETVVDALTERLDAVDAHLAQSDERHERLDARVATVDGRVDTVDDDLASVRTALETLERTCEESMTELAAFASDLEEDVVEIDRWHEQVGQAFTGTETAARAPGSIFRAEADDETTAPDASTNAPDASESSGDAPAEADGGLDYDPTRDNPGRDADGN